MNSVIWFLLGVIVGMVICYVTLYLIVKKHRKESK